LVGRFRCPWPLSALNLPERQAQVSLRYLPAWFRLAQASPGQSRPASSPPAGLTIQSQRAPGLVRALLASQRQERQPRVPELAQVQGGLLPAGSRLALRRLEERPQRERQPLEPAPGLAAELRRRAQMARLFWLPERLAEPPPLREPL
jgi:hypothetical protein